MRRVAEGVRDLYGAEVIALTTLAADDSWEIPVMGPGWLGIFFSLSRIRSFIKDCDIVHAFDVFPYGLIAVIASLGLGKKIIITGVGSNSIIPLCRRLYRPWASWVYRRANRVIAISAFTRAEILKRIPDINIQVINPGVDGEVFAKGTARGPYYDISRFGHYMLGVGQLRWRKGYHFSILAFSKIKKRFPDLSYVIVGKKFTAAYYERLRRIIREQGLEDSVFILEDVDTRDMLADVYRGAELFCLFSQNVNHDVEGFGIVFLEAAAAGLPVVGSAGCGIEDAAQDGVNGILVPSRSPDDVADAVIAILSDPAKKSTMARASLGFVRSMTWDRQIAKYAAVYDEVISQA